METGVDILETRVAAAVQLIADLRERVAALEQEIETVRSSRETSSPAPTSHDPELLEELERLRAERVTIREHVRGLLREMDRVTW